MKTKKFFIQKYINNRPLFHAFIRPTEALLFYKNKTFIKSPSLDFGCGDGFFCEAVFGKRKIDVGIDIQNSRAEEAFRLNIYKKNVFYEGKRIPFPNNYFKTIVSNCVLEHIPDLDSSLKELNRILEPGGYFLTTVMTDKWEDSLVGSKLFGKKYIKFMRSVQKHINLFSERMWSIFFEKNGFIIEKKINYFSEQESKYNEIFHYLSLPSLISYKLIKKWVIWPSAYSILIKQYFFKQKYIIKKKFKHTTAVFFILRKK